MPIFYINLREIGMAGQLPLDNETSEDVLLVHGGRDAEQADGKGQRRLSDLRFDAAGSVRRKEAVKGEMMIKRFRVGRFVEVLMLGSWARATVIKNDGHTVTVRLGASEIHIHESVLSRNLRVL